MNEEEYAGWLKKSKFIFTGEPGFIYSEAGEAGERVSDLVRGNILLSKGFADDYAEVALPDGRTGFVKSDQVADYGTWLENISFASSI